MKFSKKAKVDAIKTYNMVTSKHCANCKHLKDSDCEYDCSFHSVTISGAELGSRCDNWELPEEVFPVLKRMM